MICKHLRNSRNFGLNKSRSKERQLGERNKKTWNLVPANDKVQFLQAYFLYSLFKLKKHFATVSNVYALTKPKNTLAVWILSYFIQHNMCKIHAKKKISMHCVQSFYLKKTWDDDLETFLHMSSHFRSIITMQILQSTAQAFIYQQENLGS